MSRQQVTAILRDHCIEYKLMHGELWALDCGDTSDLWINVEGWSYRQLRSWLGY